MADPFHFNPKDTTADPDTIRSWADTVANFGDRLTGDSESLTSTLDGGAKSFTQQISSNITDSSEYQDDLWREVAWNLSYIMGVMERWATNVAWFKKRRQDLIDQHQTAVEESGLIPPRQGETKEFEGKEADWYDDLVAKHNELSDEAHDLWKRFKELADDRGEDLKKDPKNDLSAKDVEYMVSKGYLNWAPFNIMQWTHSIPVDLNGAKGREIGQNIVEGVEDGDLNQAEYEEAVLILNALGVTAAQSQADGKKLSKDEREFVDNLLAELEELPPPPAPAGLKDEQIPPRSGGVLALPDHLRALGFNDEQVKALSGGVGNAILIASDSNLGGNGYADVPDSVKSVVEGTQNYPGDGGTAHWVNDVNDLAQLIDGAAPGLEGGTGFSAGLINTIGVEIANSDNVSQMHPKVTGKSFETLIDRATLNENANYLILTDQYESASVGEVDTSKAIQGLFTYEWEDDGEAASGLMDWIPEFAQSGDAKQEEMAGESTAAFLQLIGQDSEAFENLQNTNTSIEGHKNPAFTVYNSEIADSMFKVYATYLEDFGREDPGPGHYEYSELDETETALNPLKEEGDYELVVPLQAREQFLELLVANPDAAIGVVDATNQQSQEYANSYVGAILEGDGAQPDEWVGPSARVQALVDSALVGSFENSGLEEKKALEETLKVREKALNLGVELVGLLGGSPEGDVATLAHSTIKGYSQQGIIDIMNKDLKDEIASIEKEVNNTNLKNDGQIYLDNQYMFGNALVENGVPFPESAIESEDPDVQEAVRGEFFPEGRFAHRMEVDEGLRDSYGRIYNNWVEDLDGGNGLNMASRFTAYNTTYDAQYDVAAGIVGNDTDPLTAYKKIQSKDDN
ncbi:hypothetical protein O4J56_20680 [Nocardiopsis sp. RSe5-2]|uniref:TPR repeat domain-containing protein n=1 Tax=Nocardiopsis endophytica TaxID=3018445 RepID=A0ABT4U7Z0_9ACTN|nr:hypothetical protein [Nocardiopsis endophytica]MDA2813074.1 hypothetical protein [Nocardiopsis endophytica]